MHFYFGMDVMLHFMLGGGQIHRDGGSLRNWLSRSIENSGGKFKRKLHQRKANNSSGFAFFTSARSFSRHWRIAGLPFLRRPLCTDGWSNRGRGEPVVQESQGTGSRGLKASTASWCSTQAEFRAATTRSNFWRGASYCASPNPRHKMLSRNLLLFHRVAGRFALPHPWITT